MSKYCSDCDNLNVKDNKGDGLYKCQKTKKYILACNEACDKFETCYGRNTAEKQRLYDLGKDAKNKDTDKTPLWAYIIFFILLTIVWIIGKIMGY